MPSDDPTEPTDPIDAIDSRDSGDPPQRAWRRGGTALLAALALLAAGAFGAALAGGNGSDELAVSAGSTASSTADEDDRGDQGRMKRLKEWALEHRGGGFRGGPGFGPGMGMMMMGGALHGTFVVPDPDGSGYRTMVTQRGEVTAVSDTSLTVKSEDGFTTSYRLTDDTFLLGGTAGVDAIEEGDQVSVSGVTSGGVTRALHVADLSRFTELRHGRPGSVPGPSTTTEGTSAQV